MPSVCSGSVPGPGAGAGFPRTVLQVVCRVKARPWEGAAPLANLGPLVAEEEDFLFFVQRAISLPSHIPGIAPTQNGLVTSLQR